MTKLPDHYKNIPDFSTKLPIPQIILVNLRNISNKIDDHVKDSNSS